MVTGSHFREKGCRGLMFTTKLYLVYRLRMGRAIPLLPLYAFMAWRGTLHLLLIIKITQYTTNSRKQRKQPQRQAHHCHRGSSLSHKLASWTAVTSPLPYAPPIVYQWQAKLILCCRKRESGRGRATNNTAFNNEITSATNGINDVKRRGVEP
jgi:hypothetical protein